MASTLSCLAGAAAGQAAPQVNAAVDLPATYEVGQPGLSGTVRLTAAGDTPPATLPASPGAAFYFGFCNAPTDSVGCGDAAPTLVGPPWNRGILITPSCAQGFPAAIDAPSCAVFDPGVIAIAATASGSGSGCAGAIFDVTLFDAARGTMKFNPRPPGARLWLGAPGSTCLITFAFTVQKVPADAAPATPGLQTRSLVTAGAEWNQPTVAIPHYKPEPLRAVANDVSTVTPRQQVFCDPPANTVPLPPSGVCPTAAQFCDPPANTVPLPPSGVCPTTPPPPPPPRFCDPPANTVPVPASGVCPTAGQFCDPPANTVPAPAGGVDACLTEEAFVRASMTGTPRCASGTPPFATAAERTFNVLVRVAGDLGTVARVELLQNNKVVRTLRRTNRNVVGGYGFTVDAGKLAPRSRFIRDGRGRITGVRSTGPYTITARVVLRAPGTFVRGRAVRTQTLTRTATGRRIVFRPVATCQLPDPDPPTG